MANSPQTEQLYNDIFLNFISDDKYRRLITGWEDRGEGLVFIDLFSGINIISDILAEIHEIRGYFAENFSLWNFTRRIFFEHF